MKTLVKYFGLAVGP